VTLTLLLLLAPAPETVCLSFFWAFFAGRPLSAASAFLFFSPILRFLHLFKRALSAAGAVLLSAAAMEVPDLSSYLGTFLLQSRVEISESEK
jgi:hypothetical protein